MAIYSSICGHILKICTYIHGNVYTFVHIYIHIFAEKCGYPNMVIFLSIYIHICQHKEVKFGYMCPTRLDTYEYIDRFLSIFRYISRKMCSHGWDTFVQIFGSIFQLYEHIFSKNV